MQLEKLQHQSTIEAAMFITELRGKLSDLLIQEEQIWKQRAKVFWLVEGYSNIRFFHSMVTIRCHKNKITRLMDDDDCWIDTMDGLCGLAKNYFVNLFTDLPTVTPVAPLTFRKRVARAEHNSLLSPFSYEEFELAVKQMHPDKAPGLDGLNPAFFKFFWPVLGKDIFQACVIWLEKKEFPANLNDTWITLIPKCEIPKSMRDLRPISLCNMFYKIIAKVLANRLKVILPNLISDNQSTFVPSRSILDNVIVAFEVLHAMKRRVKSKVGRVALKIHISKAYDKVSWDFLQAVMMGMGFDRN